VGLICIIIFVVCIAIIVIKLCLKNKSEKTGKSEKTNKSEPQLVIHISGPSGSGKTILGNKLQKHFGQKIIIREFNDIRDEYVKKHIDTSKKWAIDYNKMQLYLDEYIKQNNNKPLIIIGLTDNPLGHDKIYYKIPATHKFYIDIDDNILLKQRCDRFTAENIPDELNIPDKAAQNNENFKKISFIKGYNLECSAKLVSADNKKWKRYYKKQEYKIMTSELIFKHICDILS
jgi:adenylate kinase family enzyme